MLAVVLDHDVGRLHQLAQDRPPRLLFEVERDRALVAVQVLEVGAVARSAHVFVRVHAGRRLDLDHVGAEVGELLDAGRAGAHACEIDDPEARERGGRGDSGHRHDVTMSEGAIIACPSSRTITNIP